MARLRLRSGLRAGALPYGSTDGAQDAAHRSVLVNSIGRRFTSWPDRRTVSARHRISRFSPVYHVTLHLALPGTTATGTAHDKAGAAQHPSNTCMSWEITSSGSQVHPSGCTRMHPVAPAPPDLTRPSLQVGRVGIQRAVGLEQSPALWLRLRHLTSWSYKRQPFSFRQHGKGSRVPHRKREGWPEQVLASTPKGPAGTN